MAQFAKSHYTTRQEFGADKVTTVTDKNLIWCVEDDWNTIASLKANTDSKNVLRVPVYLIDKTTMQYVMDQPFEKADPTTGEVKMHYRRVVSHEEYDVFSTQHWNILAKFDDDLDHVTRENVYAIVHSEKTVDAQGKVVRINTFVPGEIYAIQKNVTQRSVGMRIKAGVATFLKRENGVTQEFDLDAYMDELEKA